MKNNRKRLPLLALALLTAFCVCIPSTLAMEGTTYTRALSADLTRAVRTQEAYIPAGTFFADLGMASPEDLFLQRRKNLYRRQRQSPRAGLQPTGEPALRDRRRNAQKADGRCRCGRRNDLRCGLTPPKRWSCSLPMVLNKCALRARPMCTLAAACTSQGKLRWIASATSTS